MARNSPTPSATGKKLPVSSRSKAASKRVAPLLKPELEKLGLKIGDPIFIRIFKEESELEVFLQGENDTTYTHFKTYKICKWSGKLGPKLKEGDGQSPEGFYFVTPGRMNPNSRFHLSFDLGYPNAYDEYHGRTGSFLMVHGACVSIGCYAMTDPLIEEIYTLAAAALTNNQKFFRVHSFPFRMTDARMNEEADKKAKWLEFWANLKEGYDYFEMMNQPPNVKLEAGKYVFGNP
ncbi:MAG: murein L,D-transpeptidase [Verrucomicrobiales bacterium]|nr:murein L,D-transpeptidase [Verrucomicrobiales bacterium]